MQRVRAEKRLRAKDISALPPGAHEDGGGLRLVVEPPRGKLPGSRRWVLRVTIAGKRHNRVKSAILRGQREKASPCIGVAQELGVAHIKVEHHRALPYAEVPGFVKTLRICNSNEVTKLAFEWLILTATRSGETRGARWEEIDETHALWAIPKERMKGPQAKRREHVVPLPARCLKILKRARALNPTNPLLFPGYRGEQLSDMTLTKVLRDLGFAERATVHGFRSSFRDWATESAKAREVVAEAALAHAVDDKTEAAYRRAVYLDERRGLMRRWAVYCCP
jgi:integrase